MSKEEDFLKAADYLERAATLLEQYYWQFARDIQIKSDYCRRRVDVFRQFPIKPGLSSGSDERSGDDDKSRT